MNISEKLGERLNIDGLSDSALVRLDDLHTMQVVPFSSSTLWRKVRNGQFPAPLKVSAGVTAWRVADIRSWAKAPSEFSCRTAGKSSGEAI